MAMYEYVCLDCHQVFDVLRPMRQADDLIRCGACESTRTRRALSLFAAQTTSAHGEAQSFGGGCACGGACACGHNHN